MLRVPRPQLSRDPNFLSWMRRFGFIIFFKSQWVKIGHCASNRNESCRFLPTVHPYIFNISPLSPLPLEKNSFFSKKKKNYEKTTSLAHKKLKIRQFVSISQLR